MGRHLIDFQLIEWPVVGLVIFASVFTIVAIRALRNKPKQEIVNLPLLDDNEHVVGA